jgi:hypothetical protein
VSSKSGLRYWVRAEPGAKLTPELLAKAMQQMLKRGKELPFRVR